MFLATVEIDSGISG